MMSGIDFGLRKENLGSLPQTPSAMILPTGDKKNAGTPREWWGVLVQKLCCIQSLTMMYIEFDSCLKYNSKEHFLLVSCLLSDTVTNCGITALYTCYFCLQSRRRSSDEIASPSGEGCNIYWTQQGSSEGPTWSVRAHRKMYIHSVCYRYVWHEMQATMNYIFCLLIQLMENWWNMTVLAIVLGGWSSLSQQQLWRIQTCVL